MFGIAAATESETESERQRFLTPLCLHRFSMSDTRKHSDGKGHKK